MSTKRRSKTTEITVEMQEFIFARGSAKFPVTWCSGCGRQVQMITAEEAASAAGVSSRTIYRWADAGKFHFTETPERLLLICRDSLLSCLSAVHRASGSVAG
jgi:excisionase family DNA binding protein